MRMVMSRAPAGAGRRASLAGRDHNMIEPHLLVALIDQQAGAAAVAGRRQRWALREQLLGPSGCRRSPGRLQLSVSNDLGRLLNVTDKLAHSAAMLIASESLLRR